jgi:hypothetical protein
VNAPPPDRIPSPGTQDAERLALAVVLGTQALID